MKEKVKQLIEEELASANAKFPAFNSPHEGWAVIKEELDELKHEVARTKKKVNYMWEMVKLNKDNKDVIEYTQNIQEGVARIIEEAIQLGAMLKKYENSGKYGWTYKQKFSGGESK